MAGRLTRLDVEEDKICEQIGKPNSKKFEFEKEIEEALKELEQYSISLKDKHRILYCDTWDGAELQYSITGTITRARPALICSATNCEFLSNNDNMNNSKTVFSEQFISL